MTDPRITLAVLACLGAPLAAGERSPEELQAMRDMTREMVLRAADYYRSVGRAVAEVEFNKMGSERWTASPYYVHMFAMSDDGTVWADNVWAEFVGTNFSLAADFHGFMFGQAILDGTPEDGSTFQIQLTFINPDSDELSPSIGHCLRPEPGEVLCSWANG